jgi:hypothetical protein
MYPLSQEETEAMETYVSESLRQGYIRSSTSPASSSFFFVKKTEGGLRPCIDYQGLNQITVRYSYPLPLIATAIESINRVRFFTKGALTTWCVAEREKSGRWLSVPALGTMSTSSCRTG